MGKEYNHRQIAELLGVERSTYTKYENGASEPSVKQLQRLKEIFGVSFDELLSPELSETEIADYEMRRYRKTCQTSSAPIHAGQGCFCVKRKSRITPTPSKSQYQCGFDTPFLQRRLITAFEKADKRHACLSRNISSRDP
ncbi:MAG: helix-turn-helix transcriptional regulator [Ruminococcus sp.]|nr:helix-turn-helix transcriptional regulator [Ruminococcus sp.]